MPLPLYAKILIPLALVFVIGLTIGLVLRGKKDDGCGNCLNGGKCVNGSCKCDSNSSGTHCEHVRCGSVSCYNGGKCVDGSCECVNGYSGKKCDETVCGALSCMNNSTCVGGECVCLTGYSGENCSTFDPVLEKCDIHHDTCPVPLLCRQGLCVCPTGFDPLSLCSSCLPGFEGPQCHPDGLVKCAKVSDCKSPKQCIDGLCLCPGNFSGPNCSECRPGWGGAKCERMVFEKGQLGTRCRSEFGGDSSAVRSSCQKAFGALAVPINASSGELNTCAAGVNGCKNCDGFIAKGCNSGANKRYLCYLSKYLAVEGAGVDGDNCALGVDSQPIRPAGYEAF